MVENNGYFADKAKQSVSDAIAKLTGIPAADAAVSPRKPTGDPSFETIKCVRKSARGD